MKIFGIFFRSVKILRDQSNFVDKFLIGVKIIRLVIDYPPKKIFLAPEKRVLGKIILAHHMELIRILT